ncbi:MAG: tetratricopeptide repeat protein, partial [Planctomycetota bacterium]|nr:tetratricopeptide repeat protein [Planctomycetota bacterium]
YPCFEGLGANRVPKFGKSNGKCGLNELPHRLSPDNVDDWIKLGEAYLIHGSYRQAEACYRHAETFRPNSSVTLLGRGIALERLGRTSEAIDLFRRIAATANADMRAEIWYRIGRNLLREEKPDEAEQAFREVLEFVPAKFQIAKLLIRSDRAEEAKPLVEELLRIGPDVMELNQLAGQMCAALGDEAGVRQYRVRMERNPNRLAVGRTVAFFRQARKQYGASRLLVEADAREKENQLSAAIPLFEEVLLHNASEPLAVKVAELNLRLDRPEQAINICKQWIDQGGASAAILDQLGSAYMALGRKDEAVKTWERANDIAIRPATCLKLAAAYQERGESDRSSQHEGLAAFARGVSFYRVDKIEQAEDDLQSAYKLYPDHAPTSYYLGQIALLHGKPNEAKAHFEQCIDFDPGHGRAFEALRRLDGPMVP